MMSKGRNTGVLTCPERLLIVSLSYPGSGVSEWEEEEAELAPSSGPRPPWDSSPLPGGSFMPSCSAISTWSPRAGKRINTLLPVISTCREHTSRKYMKLTTTPFNTFHWNKENDQPYKYRPIKLFWVLQLLKNKIKYVQLKTKANQITKNKMNPWKYKIKANTVFK